MDNLDLILHKAESWARECGALQLDYFRSSKLHSHAKLNESDIVTEADGKSEAIILKHIAEEFPEHSVLGEETGTKNVYFCKIKDGKKRAAVYYGKSIITKKHFLCLLLARGALKRAAAIVRRVPYGKEREENHHLNDLGTGELAVGSLFKSHLPFCDVYGLKNVSVSAMMH